MSIEALLVFLVAALLSLTIGAGLGVVWGDEVKKRRNLFALLALTAIVGFLVLIVVPPSLGGIYQGLKGFNLETDWIGTSVVTALFVGASGVALGFVIRSGIEVTRELKANGW